MLDHAAILMAFEQLGGAQQCLELATDYAKNRFAFGRPIGSFQAIKHKLDVYIATELARSHAYYGAWALTSDAPDLPVAAAAAAWLAAELIIWHRLRTFRPTAAWVSRGNWIAICITAARNC